MKPVVAYAALVIFGFSSGVEAQQLIARSSKVEMSRGLAAPGNVGLWLRNMSADRLVCTVEWANANGLIGGSVQIRLVPRETERVVTGLLATAQEKFSCSDDPLYAAEREETARLAEERRRRQDAELKRQQEAQRQSAQQARQEAESQRLATAEQQRHRQDDLKYQQQLREQRAEQEKQNALLAQQQALYAQQQLSLAQQRQLQKQQKEQQREQAFNQAATGLMAWAAQMDAKKAQDEEDERQEEALREKRAAAERQQQYALVGKSEMDRLQAEKEATAKKQALYAGLPVQKLPDGARDPSFPGFYVYQVRSGCAFRVFREPKDVIWSNMEWTGKCEDGYLSGEGTLTRVQTVTFPTGETVNTSLRETGTMVKGAWDGTVDLDSKFLSGHKDYFRPATGEQHRYKDGHWVTRWK